MNNYSFPEETSNVQTYELSYQEKERFTQLSLGKSIAYASVVSTTLRMSGSDYDFVNEHIKDEFNDYSVSSVVDEDFTEPPPLCPVPMLGRQFAMDEKRTVVEVAETKACDFNIEVFAVPTEPEKNYNTKESKLEGDVGFLLQSMIES